MSAPDPLDRTRDRLARLIAFPTVSARSNLELIDWAEAELADLGARTRRTVSADGRKANLLASLGPEAPGGVVLSGHTDVVPADGQAWSGDPFVAEERDGRIRGRGACDMKGFIACVLASAPRFAAAPLVRPVHVALSYDEEVGCLGAPAMIDDMMAAGLAPSACIVGEPTGMKAIEGHKGCCEYRTEFTGREGHSSSPDDGVNAVEYAARFVGELIATHRALKARAPADSPFVPPWTTVSVGRIEGGVAHNVIPDRCVVDWEMRPVRPEDMDWTKDRLRAFVEDRLLPEMRAVRPDAAIRTEIIGEVAGLEPMPGGAALALIAALLGPQRAGTVPFGTEAGLFQSRGVPAVVCGPGFIEHAHKPDEHVSIDQLALCLGMLERLTERLTRRPGA